MIIDGIHYFSRKEIQFMYVNKCLICYDAAGMKKIIREGEHGLTHDVLIKTLRFYNSETKKKMRELQKECISLDAALEADPAVIKAYTEKCCESAKTSQILRDILFFVSTLSDKEQWLFEEYFLKQRKQTDIAAEENIGVCAVSRRISRLQEKIKKYYFCM